MISFESDYNNGMLPEILERLAETNDVKTSGYGSDVYCEEAKSRIRKAIDNDGADVFFLVGGTQTNTTVIDDAKPDDLKKMKKDELLAWATRVQDYLQKEQTTVLRYDKPAANKEHPTMKPVPLVGHLIRNSSKPGQIVLDLFGGSGSTLIACEQMNRRCFIMEYDPQYADVIIDRWQQFTGKEAVKLC